MPALLPIDADEVRNRCACYLIRDDRAPRHHYAFGDAPEHAARFREAWRFPFIDPIDAVGTAGTDNRVTFIYDPRSREPQAAAPASVALLGSFHRLDDPLPLQRVEDTRYWAMSLRLPENALYRYRFLVDGEQILDPVNPQRFRGDDGRWWSRFFTERCTTSVVLQGWQRRVLDRLCGTLLGAFTDEASRYLDSFYRGLDREARMRQQRRIYRFDNSLGAVNAIDKLLAREERHRQRDYRICLREINASLRRRDPYHEPDEMAAQVYVELLRDMAGGAVPDWDYDAYRDPAFFMQLLLRHALTGVFAHPRYGGNPEGAAWMWLRQRFTASDGASVFDWPRAIERPLGDDPVYKG